MTPISKFQRRIGAVEELNRGKPQVGIANVFEIVDFVFALSIDEVPGLAGRIDGFDNRPILGVGSRPTRRHRGPKVIQHVTMESNALARRKSNFPDANPFGFGQ